MDVADDHIQRAEKNEAFAGALNRTDPVQADWAITALFYGALHYIDAYFLSHGRGRPRTHGQREPRIRDSADLIGIWPDYRRLKDMSLAARYDIANYAEADFNVAANALAKVRSHVLLYRKRP